MSRRIVLFCLGKVFFCISVAYAQDAPLTPCDTYAAAPTDPQHRTVGVVFDKVNPGLAIPACEVAVRQYPGTVRLIFQLGRAYQRAENFGAALVQYRKAAQQEYAPAQSNLGHMYANGLGVPKDLSLATEWFSKAAENGSDEAAKNLKALSRLSPPTQAPQTVPAPPPSANAQGVPWGYGRRYDGSTPESRAREQARQQQEAERARQAQQATAERAKAEQERASQAGQAEQAKSDAQQAEEERKYQEERAHRKPSDVKLELREEVVNLQPSVCNSRIMDCSAKELKLINKGESIKIIQAVINNKPGRCTIQVNKILTMGDAYILVSAFDGVVARQLGSSGCGELVKVNVETDQGEITFGPQ